MKSTDTRTNPPRRIGRRSFLKEALAASASSMMAPQLMFGAAGRPAPSDPVRLACCGVGHRGADIINALHATGLADVVALCDTDMGARHTWSITENFPNAARFQDFRRMFDKMGDQIDAVSIGTPDHSHFPIAMLAMSLGKHVYVEKPLAHTYHEIDLLMRAEKKYKVAAQMGNQGHSEANYHQFKTWVDSGIIRNVTRITAFMNKPRRWHGMQVYDYLEGEPMPYTLDWDTWLTTTQSRPYNKGYMQGDWRSWYAFGNGALGDWGAHIVDTAHEFLNLGMPVEVDPVMIEGHSEFIFPQASTLSFKFPARGKMPPVELTWYDGVNNLPPLPDNFEGTMVNPGASALSSGHMDTQQQLPGKVIYGEDLTFKGESHGSTLRIIPDSKARDMEPRLPRVPEGTSNHFLNFLRSCKGEEKCRSSFAVAGPLCQMMALGVIAQRLNRKLTFDRKSGQITNDKIANQLLADPPPRQGWEEFYALAQ